MNYWIAVVSKNYVQMGIDEGILHLCHGKEAPLKRIQQGDGIIYYSPTMMYNGKEKCQSFTGIGRVTGEHAYLHEMEPGVNAFRKDAEYYPAADVLIAPLIPSLSFITNKKNWGILFRSGLLKISYEDFKLIAQQMKLSSALIDELKSNESKK